MMVCICERKNLNRAGAPLRLDHAVDRGELTELMRLLGKTRRARTMRLVADEQLHIFFPRSSFIGREQKSSCQSYDKSTISPEGARLRRGLGDGARGGAGGCAASAGDGGTPARSRRAAAGAARGADGHADARNEAAVADIVRACGSRYRRRDEVE